MTSSSALVALLLLLSTSRASHEEEPTAESNSKTAPPGSRLVRRAFQGKAFPCRALQSRARKGEEEESKRQPTRIVSPCLSSPLQLQ